MTFLPVFFYLIMYIYSENFITNLKIPRDFFHFREGLKKKKLYISLFLHYVIFTYFIQLLYLK
jgi:hypothetical protein